MGKFKFTQEYPFKTSPKVLFNYISTPGGLQQWFADKVTMDRSNNFKFYWDNEEHSAVLSSVRLNKSTKFEFLGEHEGNFVEFKLVTSEIDNSTFLKIIDCSDDDDVDELNSLWKGLIADLKEIVGG